MIRSMLGAFFAFHMTNASLCLAGDGKEFVASVRQLFIVQDRLAAGDPGAPAEQDKKLASVIEAYGPETARIPLDDTSVRTLAALILSGGHPGLSAHVLKSGGVADDDKALVKAATEFMLGRLDRAAKDLAGTETEKLPPALAGRVELARAAIASFEKSDVARHIDRAVAMMPGTLVEESALRRGIVAAASIGDEKRFWKLASRYVRRFPNSLYRAEFADSLVNASMELEKGGLLPDRLPLQVLLDRMDTSVRLGIYIQLTRAAANAGQPSLCTYAARRARRLAIDGSLEADIADLYIASFDLFGERFEQRRSRLEAINPMRLPESERQLREAALQLALNVKQATPIDRDSLALMPEADLHSPEFDELTRKAQDSLSLANALIKPEGSK